MDIMFVTEKGRSFTIKVGYNDTIAMVKEKVQKYQQIPVAQQTLFYQDSLLWDESNIERSRLFDRSRVRLLIADNKPPPPPAPASSLSERIMIFILLPNGKITISKPKRTVKIQDMRMCLEMARKESKIELPEEYFLIHNQYVMEEKESLEGIGVKEGDSIKVLPLCVESHGDINIDIPSSATSSSSSSSETICAVLVLPDQTIIIFKPKRMLTIQELRMDLERDKKDGKFELPDEYFFARKTYVMDEKESLEGLGVQDGDFINIVQGRAPSPSPSSSSSSSNMIRIFFEIFNGKKLLFNAKSTMKVQEMRRDLEKARKDAKFELQEPYFFVYNRTKMKEKQSLERHGVRDCDSIMIFPGTLLPYHCKP